MKKEDIRKLIESGKSDEEILKQLAPVKAAIKDMTDDEIKQIAVETADNLLEFNQMNDLLDDQQELYEAAEKIYAWLYDEAWMIPKDGWKNVESKEKVKADGEDIKRTELTEDMGDEEFKEYQKQKSEDLRVAEYLKKRKDDMSDSAKENLEELIFWLESE